jgi:hypothetical protein
MELIGGERKNLYVYSKLREFPKHEPFNLERSSRVSRFGTFEKGARPAVSNVLREANLDLDQPLTPVFQLVDSQRMSSGFDLSIDLSIDLSDRSQR